MALQKLRYISLVLVLTCLVACSDNSQNNGQGKTELVVLTRNAPTTWYEDREGYAGPEYDLVKSFAAFKKIKVRFVVLDSISEILEAIKEGRGDIAAAGLTRTPARLSQGLNFAPVYQQVRQQVVCRRNNGGIPRKLADLPGKRIAAVANSSYEELLIELQRQYPELKWRSESGYDTEQLMQQVWLRKLDCTIADSNIVSITRRYYPELVVAFDIGSTQDLSWVIADDSAYLSADLQKWLSKLIDDGELGIIMERYFGHVDVFDYVDMSKYVRRIKSRLPGYQKNFENAAKNSGLPWTLLAAQAYQESHWNPRAKSPTGVRGMMMLTLNTAKSLGVTSRLDPVQSIEGGARYLQRMLKRIPQSVREQDRLWYALAAYNIGFGHLRDARTLALRLGRNPDLWLDLKEVLPLLSQKKYYKTLRYGYARGTEPVRYVQRIRNYRQVLERSLKQH